MSQPDFEISMLGIRIVPADIWTGLAGFTGAVISLQFLGPMTMRERLALLASGVVAAQFLSPMAADFAVNLGWETAFKYLQSIGLLVGIFAMSLIRAILKIISNVSADPKAWIRLILTRS